MKKKLLTVALSATMVLSSVLTATAADTATASVSGYDISTGLVAQYSFEDSLANGAVTDSAATMEKGEATYVDGGISGKAFDFSANAGTSQLANAKTAVKLDKLPTTTAFTVSMWVKSAANEDGTSIPGTYFFADGCCQYFQIRSNGDGAFPATRASMSSDCTWDNVVGDHWRTGKATQTANTWQMVTLTVSSTGKATVYVDGVEVAEYWEEPNYTDNWFAYSLDDGATYLNMFSDSDGDWNDVAFLGSGDWWSENFAGQMDEVYVYSRELTATDVKALYFNEFPMTGFELALESQNMVAGNTLELKYSVVPADTLDVPTITWTTSDSAVATVENGVVTAVAEGTATITATATVDGNSFTDACTIKVVNEAIPLKDVTVKAEPTTILKDTVTNIQVAIDPVDTTDDTTTTFTSSDEKIAKVDSKGVVTGIAAGDATITVKVGSIEKTVKITVINPSPEASKNPSADASKTEDDATGVITADELKKLTIKLEGMDDKLVVSPVAADSADYKVAAAAKELKDLKWVAIDLKLESGKQPANGTKITLSLMDAIKDAKYVKVFRVDGTKLVLVDHVEVKDGKFTFAPDHFSTYIFAATTEAPTANPNTGDSTSVALALALASIAAVSLVAVRAKRRENA